MAIHTTPVQNYANQLEEKKQRTLEEFSEFGLQKLEVFASPASRYRMRAEFKIWQEQQQAHYAMYAPGQYKKPVIIERFEPGSETIQQLMPKLLEAINSQELLRQRLFQAEFLSSQDGQCVVTLIYHKALSDAWHEEALKLAQDLNIDIIGRSRKQKRVIGKDHIFETFVVDGQRYKYQQVEASFTQPNARICQAMLQWVCDSTANITVSNIAAPKKQNDLLELYCGNGNFTLPLSKHFNKVLATEIAKSSIQSATLNCELNQINNIRFVRMSSEEFTQALNKVRPFRRLSHIDLENYTFSTVLVDPPRAGLDNDTCELIQRFENIIYISCNPETLRENLKQLSATHSLVKMALFDQFPYTEHRECGVILRKN